MVSLCWTTQARRVPLPQKVLWGSIDPESLLASQKHPSPENVETLGQVSEMSPKLIVVTESMVCHE